MAATSHPLATLAAVETLRAGGNAADAAVTAIATLGVVEPHMTGIGGDCFCLVAKPGEPVWGYNGSGRSGAAMTLDIARAPGGRLGPASVHAVTVPGSVEAWHAILTAHGRFGLDRALQPAIHYAREGFPIAARVAHDWALEVEDLRRNAGAAQHYLFDGRAPREGDVVRFPALAQTLESIAALGPRAFYTGPIAADMVQTLAALGSVLTLEDFSRHRGEVAAPITTDYRGLEILELPPNGQGITALVLLNILERFDLAALDPRGAERFHLMLEAARLAFAVRDDHVADPAHMRTPPAALLDKAFAAKLAARIDLHRRTPLKALPMPGSDTVYVTVVDRDRMAVSIINSLFSHFGVGIATERTGIVFNNRGSCFVLEPGHPNAIGPDKRPLHTIIPALAMRAGRCELTFGVMGAHYQPMGHVQLLTDMLDYGLDPQAAIDMPRAFFEGDTISLERGIPEETVAGLKARGHAVAVRSAPYGGAQAVRIDWDRGVLIGASDPRKDGCALGY